MRKLVILLLAVCLLAGCSTTKTSGTAAVPEASAETPVETQAETEIEDVNAGFVAAPSTVTASASTAETVSEAAEEEETVDLAEMTIDPAYDFDIDTMVPSDFGDFFTASYETTIEEYTILPGDSYSNTVTVLRGAEEGPTLYVVAGVHGDEEAAWQTGKLLKKISIKAGTLYILAPANPWGASKVPKSRYTDGADLNRSFPGSASGNAAERVANAIYSDIADKQPQFLFDLHEARVVEADRDFLGSSLIFTDLTGMEDMFLDLILATQEGEICSMPFNYYSPGPDGSINNTVTTSLGIPTLTVETFRGYAMETRISDQLDVIQYVLRYYGMVD